MVSELLTADAHGVGTAQLLGERKLGRFTRPCELPAARSDEFPLEQTTSFGKEDALPPSSPHAGINNVRTQ